MSSTIFIARHGETEWNRLGRWQGVTDIPLSDVGRAQARQLAARLHAHGITHVHASHLSRARETAEIIASQLGVATPTLDARLRERGYGRFEGLTGEECNRLYPDVWQRYLADRRQTPPEAEAQTDIVARMTAAMQEIIGAHTDRDTVLVISHGGAIRSFLHVTFGIAPPPIGNGSAFRLSLHRDRFVSVDEA